MTLPSSGQISARDILVESRAKNTDAFDINVSKSRNIAKKIVANSQISYADFYGKNYAYCIIATTAPAMAPWGVWGGSYGNNPADATGWPYGAWGADIEYSNSSGSAYYPLIAPGGPLYFTFGVDNYGILYYAQATSQTDDPRVLNYTALTGNTAFPGVNNWTFFGNFAADTILWFYIAYGDLGRVFNMTFAISSGASNATVLTHSRMLTSAGQPYYCMPGASLAGPAAPAPAVYNEGVVAPASVLVNQQYNISIVNGAPNGQFVYTQNGVNPITLTLDGSGSYVFTNLSLGAAGTYVYEFTFLSTGAVRSVTTVATVPVPVVSSYTTPGTYTLTIPSYNSLTVTLFGAGGGGGGTYPGIGTTGGTTDFAGLVTATGGGGGIYYASVGSGGIGTGGDANYTGGSGGAGSGLANAGYGGSGGAAGGYGVLTNAGAGTAITALWNAGYSGNPYGGGGSGATSNYNVRIAHACGAGGGGAAVKTFTAGVGNAPVAGTVITLVVGAGGTSSGSALGKNGGTGGSGAIFLSWI